MTDRADFPPFDQVVAAAGPAPAIPEYADTSLPVPPFPGRTLPEAAADSTCTRLVCQMDPGTDLVLLTLYVMLCFMAMTVMLKLVELSREAVWEIVYLLRDARVSARRTDRR